MARTAPTQFSFTSGEFSPRIFGRSDLNQYSSGAKQIENFTILRAGGLLRRSGTRFVHESIDSSERSRLIPFVFSDRQAYILELGDERMRVFRDEGIVQAASHDFLDADVDVADDHVTISGGHFYIDEQGPFRLTSTGTLPGGLSTGTDYYIIKVTDSDFRLSLTPGGGAVDITSAAGGGTHTIAPQGDVPFEVVTPWAEADLYRLHFVQSFDQIFVVHGSYRPYVISRTDHDAWVAEEFLLVDGPYLERQTWKPGGHDPSLTLSYDSGAETLSASQPIFDADDVGRLVRLDSETADPNDWAPLRITGFNTSSSVDVERVSTDDPAPAAGGNQVRWHAGIFGDSPDLGQPRTIVFFENRLFFAGASGHPQSIWGSVTDDYDNFATTDIITNGVSDDSALFFTLAGRDANVIVTMAFLQSLIAGTGSTIWVVQPTSSLEALTPTNIIARPHAARGANPLRAVHVDDRLLYLSATGRQLHAAGFQIEREGIVPIDLTILSDHILLPGTDDITFAQEPHDLAWLVRSDGEVASLTYVPEQRVFGWSRQILGGSFSSGPAVAESVATIPGPLGDYDQTWVLVKRTVDGNTVRYIEFLEQDFRDTDNIEDAFHVDSGLSYDGAPTSTVSGLDHLEGETVQVFADGTIHPDRTVSGGSITLDNSYSKVHVGLGYTSTLETLDLNPGPASALSAAGSQARKKRTVEAVVRFHRTLGGQFMHQSGSAGGWDPIPDSTDAPFTGDARIHVGVGWERSQTLMVRQPSPAPMVILSVLPEVDS